jgi:hypothetical protein
LADLFKIFNRNQNGKQKLNLQNWKENFKFFLTSGRRYVTPTTVTGSVTIVIVVKWSLNSRKCFVCSSSITQNLCPVFNGIFRGSSIKIHHVRNQFALYVELLLYWNINSFAPSVHNWELRQFPCMIWSFLSSLSSDAILISICRLMFLKLIFETDQIICDILYIA